MKKRSAKIIAMGMVMGMFAVSVPQVDAADMNVGTVGSKVEVQKSEEISLYEDSEMMQGQWIKSGNKWWFRFEDGTYPKDVMMEDEKGHVFAFDKDGWMVTGWYRYKDVFEIDDEVFDAWYYFDTNGYMTTGWKKINNVWYYFDKDEGWMYFWDVYEIDGARYYFQKSGAMATGWSYDASYEEWFYANSAGKLLNGWQYISGSWYYLDKADYFMYSDGIWEIETNNGTQLYAFDKNGRMIKGWYHQVWNDGTSDWFYFDTDGTPYDGWKSIGGKWYYMDEGVMYSDVIAVINGANYAFKASGEMITGWHMEKYADNSGADWWYFDANGKGHDGWVTSQGKWYWTDGGYMNVEKYHITDNGKLSEFDGNGVWIGYVEE